ncbi:MAG: hypothetical protein NTU69_01210, partial [Proteobacteria bacterium]|nr:hypothetical protein [Pseudomonadota bacterium]
QPFIHIKSLTEELTIVNCYSNWSFLTFVFQYSRNTVLLSAPLRVFTPTRKRVPGLEFHSIRELVLRTQTAQIVLQNVYSCRVGYPKMLEVAIRKKFFRPLQSWF